MLIWYHYSVIMTALKGDKQHWIPPVFPLSLCLADLKLCFLSAPWCPLYLFAQQCDACSLHTPPWALNTWWDVSSEWLFLFSNSALCTASLCWEPLYISMVCFSSYLSFLFFFFFLPFLQLLLMSKVERTVSIFNSVCDSLVSMSPGRTTKGEYL